MFAFLIVLISVIALLLILIVLLQAGKGGGLAASFGGASSSTESFIGGRQAATLLTKLTWIGGGSYIFLALVLAILSSRSTQQPESVLRNQFGPGGQAAPEAPASVLQSETDGEGVDAGEGDESAAEPGGDAGGAGDQPATDGSGDQEDGGGG